MHTYTTPVGRRCQVRSARFNSHNIHLSQTGTSQFHGCTWVLSEWPSWGKLLSLFVASIETVHADNNNNNNNTAAVSQIPYVESWLRYLQYSQTMPFTAVSCQSVWRALRIFSRITPSKHSGIKKRHIVGCDSREGVVSWHARWNPNQ